MSPPVATAAMPPIRRTNRKRGPGGMSFLQGSFGAPGGTPNPPERIEASEPATERNYDDFVNSAHEGLLSTNWQAGRWFAGIDRPMESFSLETVHVKFAAFRAAPGVHVNRARSKGTTWLKKRFAVWFRVSNVFNV